VTTPESPFLISNLLSGGLITNYSCTSRCGHCLYGCSPRREKEFIARETAQKCLEKIKSLGCTAVHVGGGEPFLNPEGLKMVAKTALCKGVHIEYVETNSSWYRDRESACQILTPLKEYGVYALLVSMSPFHNEHIPFYKVKGVIEACHDVGMNIFPWLQEFYPEIDSFDDKTTHGIGEYEKRYGRDYLSGLPSRYWIHLGGRALMTFARVFMKLSFEEILSFNRSGCLELLDVSHFHFDLWGNYIPGLCSGLAIQCDDLGKPLSPEKYPFLCTLFQKGVGGLLDLVSNRYNFKPSQEYISKCHLCFDIRRYLVLEQGLNSRELQPKGFYEDV